MNTVEELKAEIESLKSVIRKNNETIQSLQKLNSWYEEQLKFEEIISDNPFIFFLIFSRSNLRILRKIDFL